MPANAVSGERDRAGALRLVLDRVGTVLEETGDAFPLFREEGPEGRWQTTEDGNWCAGYWIGLLWLAARHAPDIERRQHFIGAARQRLPALLAQSTAHLFAGLNCNYAGFLGYDVTGEPDLRAIGVHGAEAMLALYNPNARQVPIGTYTTAPAQKERTARTPLDRTNFAAVDAVHTAVPILLRAAAETGRAEYREVALAHVARHLEWHVRSDGSTSQMTVFDPTTGAPQQTFSTLAATDEGCWSRGLGWHVAGTAAAYVATGDASLLAVLERSIAYYRERTGEDLLPAWDLALDGEGVNRDASAAAIVAYGLLNLKRRASARTRELEAFGAAVLDSLLATCLVWEEGGLRGAVLHGCYRYPRKVAVDNELIWTNFYVAAALDQIGSGS